MIYERTERFDLPIENLSYDYVDKCEDVNELEKIYTILKDGDEGKFPDLEKHCRKRLNDICPTSRALRQSFPVLTPEDLTREDRDELNEDLQDWVTELKKLEKCSKNKPSVFDEIPPVRSADCMHLNQDKNIKNSNTSKRCVPRSYSEWDKLDKEIEKGLTDEKGDHKAEKGSEISVSESEIKLLSKSELSKLRSRSEKLPLKERVSLSRKEKEKGNEAFHTQDFQEAIRYYDRSAAIYPTVAIHNNKSLIYIKQSRWKEAVKEASNALELEPENEKALFRRAKAYLELHKLLDAERDLEKVTNLDLSNVKAQDLLRQVRDAMKKRESSKLEGGRRLKVEEVGGSDRSDSESCEDEEPPNSYKKVYEILDKKSIKAVKPESPSQLYERLKSEGNEFHQKEFYQQAIEKYSECYFVAKDKRLDKQFSALALRNRALAEICQENFQNAFSDCNRALQIEPNCPKTLYRRALARRAMDDFTGALIDLEKALKLLPGNGMIKNLMEQVIAQVDSSNKIEEQNCGDADLFGIKEESFSLQSNDSDVTNLGVTISPSSNSEGDWELLKRSPELEPDPSTTTHFPNREELQLITAYSFDSYWCDISSRIFYNVQTNSTDPKLNIDIIQLLKRISPEKLSQVLGLKCEATMLDAFFMALNSIKNADPNFVKDVLLNLCNVPRIDIAALMISTISIKKLDACIKILEVRKLLSTQERNLLNSKLNC